MSDPQSFQDALEFSLRPALTAPGISTRNARRIRSGIVIAGRVLLIERIRERSFGRPSTPGQFLEISYRRAAHADRVGAAFGSHAERAYWHTIARADR